MNLRRRLPCAATKKPHPSSLFPLVIFVKALWFKLKTGRRYQWSKESCFLTMK